MLRPDVDRDERGSDRPGQAPFNVVSCGGQGASLVVSGGEAFGNCACAGKNVRCCPLIVQPEGHLLQRALRTRPRSSLRRTLFARGSEPFGGPARAPRRCARLGRSRARGRPRAASTCSARIPRASRSCRTRRSPEPRRASSSARPLATRSSSTAPARTSRSTASLRTSVATFARASRSESSRSERSRCASDRAARLIASCRRSSRRRRRARRPVELDPDVEPRGEHDLGRQGPPRLALELDLDP